MKNQLGQTVKKIAIAAVMAIVLLSLSNCLLIPIAMGMTDEKIQNIQGSIKDGIGIVYTLENLKKGETLFFSMKNAGGNLDPMLGILDKPEELHILQSEAMKLFKESGLNLIDAANRFADDHFLAWDDDSGDGYNALLKFQVPADGTYFLFAGSMFTNQ